MVPKVLACEFTEKRPGQICRQHARILLTTPLLSRYGGVAQYMHILQPHWHSSVQYFYVGSRADDESALATLWRMAVDSYRFAKSAKQGRYDLVHLNPSIGPKALVRDGILLAVAKAHRKPVLVFAHGWNPAWADKFPKYVRWLFRFVYSRADGFVVLGTEFERRARLLGFRGRIFVESAPVPDEFLEEAANEPETAVCKSTFNILFLARVEADKGIYEALETYQRLKRNYEFVTLTVAGDGTELSAARHYAASRNLKDVSFLGHVKDAAKRNALKKADVYLFPSHHEGLPLSVLEAMAFGLPVITSAVGGLPDFFEDGAMGFITSSRDSDILASLVDRLILDPGLRARIGNFNYLYARAHFSARQIAARLEQIYGFLLKGTDRAFLPTG
ncbi:MAG: glycosyltransferase family 4 protein [Acidobacteriaceae bacterium]|nr:glycosyltransferase family 4 protein [Acidobacteriaceae bacterium]